MLRDIVRFEWRYHTRQVSFVAAALLFFAFGFAFTARSFGPANVHIDSPYSVAQSVGVLSLFSLFVVAVFCANAVVRDQETRMAEIVFTTSVDKLPFLLGRFTGSFLAAFTAFSASALGMYLARFLPWHDADRLGSASPLPHLWALLVIALPNLLFAAVVLFALSTITRSVLASYAGSVLIWVLYFVAAAMSNSPLMASSAPNADTGASLAALLDPFALSAFFEQTRNWTPAVRNTRLLSLSGDFLLNRLLWIGVSMAILAVVYRIFSFRVSATSRKAPAKEQKEAPISVKRYTPVPATESQWGAFLSATKLELRAFLLNRPFIAMALLWAGLIAFEMISDITQGEYGSAVYPAAGILFATIRQPLAIITTILLIYTSAEMVWRERALRISGILHATPTENAVFVAAKCTALAALVGVLTAVALGIGALLQIANGWPVDAMAFLSFAWFAAAPLMLFGIAAIVIQTLSPHKYAGMFLVLVVGMAAIAGEMAGLHPLARFAPALPLAWSEMNGFGRTAGLHWPIVYSAAIAALFLLFAVARWRGRRERVRLVPALALGALIAAAGALIVVNTRGIDVPQWRAGYEKKYKSLATLAQPRVSEVKATIDVADSHRVRGEYTLLNDTAAPIEKIVVTLRREAKGTSVTIPAARLLEHDPRFNVYVFALAQPLGAGQRTTVHFDVAYENQGFANDPTFAANGAYIASARTFPQLGYRAGYELDDPRERRRRGLPPSTPRPESEIPVADWARLDLTVTTSRDQVAVAPGRLVRDWQHDGRRSFHFRSDAPVPNQFAVSTARYAVAKKAHRGVSIEVYHHPSHTFNIERMQRAAAESLDYYTANFGPYPHPHLRLAEVAIPNFSAFAQPGLIFLGERRAFLVDGRDPRRLDLVYRRVAHELAHQWWGYTVVPADVPGATAITESLTKYAELMVLGRAHGREEVRQSLTYELDLYLSGRTSERGAEPPLSRAGDQSYLYYRKGSLVLYGLKDLLGESAVNTALRNFLREQGGPQRKPTTTQLVQHLHAVATQPMQHTLIEEWLNGVTLYDFKLDSATARRRADGRFDVTLRVTAAKTTDDDTPLPLSEPIEIGVFAGEEALHLAKHPLRQGTQEIRLVVAKAPNYAAVDPYVTRIDRNRFDNGVPVP